MTFWSRAAVCLCAGGLAAGALAGCGGSATNATPSATPSGTPTPSAAAQALSRLATASRDSNFSGQYLARANNGRTATVRVFLRDPSTFRIDVVEGAVTAQLFGTARGTIACNQMPKVKPACYLVAAPGAAIPNQFNAGLQRVFSIDVPQLAKSTAAFTVAEGKALAAHAKLPAARCFSVTGGTGGQPITAGLVADVDLGTYCLGTSGPPRVLRFTSGTLTLTVVGPPPSAKQLTLPAPVRPLPTSTSKAPSPTVRNTPPVSGLPSP